jgi:hypothetical protein
MSGDTEWLKPIITRAVSEWHSGVETLIADGGHDICVKAINDAEQAIIKEIDRVIGEPRPYREYEPCPRCGGQYQYKCSCHDAEEALMTEMRLRAGLEDKK